MALNSPVLSVNVLYTMQSRWEMFGTTQRELEEMHAANSRRWQILALLDHCFVLRSKL